VNVPSRRARLACALAVLLASPLAAQSTGTAAPDLQPRTKGSAKAPITVYEMSDFQCPYCRRHALETFPELERDYVSTGKVRWVFVNLPLTQLHPNAAPAAEVAMCAARQGKFWEVHDLLFRNQKAWSSLKEPGSYFLTFADSARLDKPALQKCLAGRETVPELEADANGAIRSGANSTPTFYIEGGLLEGAYPAAAFRQIFDSIHAERTRPK
jgi:protein-disulfide isomerase